MAKKIKDTDYLAISARVKAMETTLLTWERMMQILDARSEAEALKMVQESGYPDLTATDPEALDRVLSAAREEMLSDLTGGAPDPRYIELFKIKYDYHNVKAILKAAAMGISPERMLMDMGRVSAAELREAVAAGELDGLPAMLAAAVQEAKAVLETTRDPQLSDIVLDRWYYLDLAAVAEETGSAFLDGYVKVQIDAANLRVLVRTLRMGKNAAFLQDVLFEGGDVTADQLLKVAAAGGSGLTEAYAAGLLEDAAAAGAAALQGGALTEFEKLCDDAVNEYLSGAQFVPFGEAPLVGYLAGRETEFTNLRILLIGRSMGLAPEIIRDRLRRSCV